MTKSNKVIFIDNQDSFTYNLVDELLSLEFDVEVYRNTVDASFIENIIDGYIAKGIQPILFLSPGPGRPDQSPCMMQLISFAQGKIPIIGVCLGHQALAQHYGGNVTVAGTTVHGKSSFIEVTEHSIFRGLGNALQVARYHSLIVNDLPEQLEVIGKYQDLTMAMIDESNRVLGFQFHPESILTTQGSTLLKQSIEYLLEA